ncbi:MAG: hypothetical protein C4291_01390 [Candidatus Dadabacteria bacterium]
MNRRFDITYDVRVVERNIREGAIVKKDYEEYLKKLPDISDKGCPLIVDGEPEENQSQLNANDEGENR